MRAGGQEGARPDRRNWVSDGTLPQSLQRSASSASGEWCGERHAAAAAGTLIKLFLRLSHHLWCPNFSFFFISVFGDVWDGHPDAAAVVRGQLRLLASRHGMRPAAPAAADAHLYRGRALPLAAARLQLVAALR